MTEISLDAVQKNRNQFDKNEIKQENGWTLAPGEEGQGYQCYRVLEADGDRYKVEYHENGGGTLTTGAIIEFTVDRRQIRVDGVPTSVRVLRVHSYSRLKLKKEGHFEVPPLEP